jgi:hypothetical protein
MSRVTAFECLFAVVGAGLLVVAGAMRANTKSFLAHASPAQGTVVALQPRRSSDNSTTYAAVVRFKHGSQAIQFTSQTSSSPPAYGVGEIVPVLYLETNPYEAKVDAFFSLWGGQLIVGFLGTVFLLVGGGLIASSLRSQGVDDDQDLPVGADSVSINGGVRR